LKAFDKDSETPELIWDADMRSELRSALGGHLDQCFEQRANAEYCMDDFELTPHFRVTYKKLKDELCVGGVYVRLYLKEPTFSLRDPTSFLERLLHRWAHELEMVSSAKPDASHWSGSGQEIVSAQQDKLELVTSATIYLCKVRETLCDKLSEWGYMTKSIFLLQSILALELLGSPLLSVVRLLHVASNRMANVESLAVVGNTGGQNGFVFTIKRSIKSQSLHDDCAFMIEMLKKVYMVALGDLTKSPVRAQVKIAVSLPTRTSFDGANPYSSHSSAQQSYQYMEDQNPAVQAMAPSPAPGLDPVRSNRVRMEQTFDDPLMAFVSPPTVPGPPTTAGVNIERGMASSAALRGDYHPNYHNQPAGQQHQLSAQTGALSMQRFQPPHNHQLQYGSQKQRAMPPFSTNPPVDASFNYPPSPSPALDSQFGGLPGYQKQYGNLAQNAFQHSAHAEYQNAQEPRATQQPVRNFYAQRTTAFSTIHSPAAAHPMQAQSDAQPSNPNNRVGEQQQASAVTAQTYSGQSQLFSPPPTGFQGQALQYTASAHSVHAQPQPSQHPVPHRVTSMPTTPAFHPATYQRPSEGQSHHTAPSLHNVQQQALVMDHQQQPLYQQSPYSGQYQNQHQQPQILYEHQSKHQQAHGQGQSQTLGHYHHEPPSAQEQELRHQQSHQPEESRRQEHHQSQVVLEDQPTSQQSPHLVYQSHQTHQQPTSTAQVQQFQPLSSAPTSQYRLIPVEGSGIDARTAIDPKVLAEQHVMSIGGAPGSAQGRVALLQSALSCNLAEFLVNEVLEDQSLAHVKDPAAAKVHAVELLTLLTKDPGFGMKFKLILDDIPAWKKYKFQDHSLFITGAEQRTDYFLTDGGLEQAKLLTE
jgi:DNAJ protein RME-8 N-terminal